MASITVPTTSGTGGDSEHVEAEAITMALRDARPATLALHADESLRLVDDIAPPIHVSTTFKYPNDPQQLMPFYGRDIGVFRVLHLFFLPELIFASRLSSYIPESHQAIRPVLRQCYLPC